jgi:hypothetical protein
MKPEIKERWARRYLARAVKLLPSEVTVRLTCRYDEANAASCVVEPEYYRAQINANLEYLHTKRAIAEHVFHEVVHIPLWPLFDMARDLCPDKFTKKQVRKTNEFVTTSIELMFFKLVFPELE